MKVKTFFLLLLVLSLTLGIAPPVQALESITTRVSVDSSGNQANDVSDYAKISANGRYVVFASWATNLVPGDTNGAEDVFVHDLFTGVTTRVSVDSSGNQANQYSNRLAISADGRYVVFESLATNLVSGDTNGTVDIFVHDQQTGLTERVSLDSLGGQANSASYNPAISGDGRFVAFASYASNLVVGDVNGQADVFLHDRWTGTTELISVDSFGVQGNGTSGMAGWDPIDVSDDGRYVAFDSEAPNLVPGDANGTWDIFVRDRTLGVTELISVNSSGVQANEQSECLTISPDGRLVAFVSRANNLAGTVTDSNWTWDVFLRDRAAGTTVVVSVNAAGTQTGNGESYFPSMTPDGQYIAFGGWASNLVAGDVNGQADVFVRDMVTGTTELVSVDSGGNQGNNYSYWSTVGISAAGNVVVFGSVATNLVPDDTNGVRDIFVRGRASGVGVLPAGYDFGDHAIHTTSAAQTFTLTNYSAGDLHLGTLSVSGEFVLSNDSCSGQTIASFGSCTFDVAFAPLHFGVQNGSVSIPSDAPSSPDSVLLRGNCVNMPPTVDIASPISSAGSYLLATINLSDPENDPLSGVVQILGGADAPTSVLFETLTTCGAGSNVQLLLNGALVGQTAMSPNCMCGDAMGSVTFSGPEIAANFNLVGSNTWTYTNPNPSGFTTWARIVVHYPDGSTQNACLFDNSGSGCITPEVCNGLYWGSVSGSQTLPAATTVLASQAYTNSVLPASFDISALAPGNYFLYANADDGFNPLVSDIEPFTVAGETNLYINGLPDTTPPTVLYGPNTVPANGSVLLTGPTQIVIEFSEDVLADGSANAANNANNYLLVEDGANNLFDTLSCAGGVVADDARVTVNSAVYNNNGGAGPYLATLNINNGVPLPNGVYRLFICGTTSVYDLAGNRLNNGLDSVLNFSVRRAGVLPATGFAPDRATALPPQAVPYAASDLRLEIPRLGVKMDIVGVPLVNGEWDVTWLGNQAGWLQGTAFPTWNGNSVITGHVWNADNTAGPFVYLNTLWYGDHVIVHAWGQQYIYEVRSVKQVRPDSTVAAFQHRDTPWLTLTTCRSYDPDKGTYRYRVIVQATLVEIK